MVTTNPPSQLDLFINQGASYFKEFILIDEYGYPVDMTGTTISMKIRRYAGVANEPTTIVCSIISPGDGTYSVAIASSQTLILKNTRYIYEIKATEISDSTKVYTILFGQLHITNF